MSFYIAAPAHKSQAVAYCNRAFTAVLALLAAGSVAQVLGQANEARKPSHQELVKAERYDIDVSFQPEKAFLHARAAITLRVLPPPPPEKSRALEAIEFELNPHLKILEVTDAQSRKLEFNRSGRLGSSKLLVRLAEPVSVPSVESLRLTFTYEGALPLGPLDYITKDGILLRDESRWYPAIDLSAFTQNDLTIRAPAGWQSISTGEEKGGDQEGRYVTTHPVSSRSIAALPYWEKFLSRKPLLSPTTSYNSSEGGPYGFIDLYLTERDIKIEAHLADKIVDILSSGSSFSLWDIPNRKKDLAVIQGFPGQRGAIGYSAPGFMVVSEDVVKFHGYPGFAPEFLPHEIAHQWFPIEVTIARQEDGWLAESLAEYLAWRYLQKKNPGQARLMVTRAMRDALAPDPLRPLSLGLRLFTLENNDVTHATLYQRGILIFRTLETVIDRERLDRALREYYKRFAGRSASIADFHKICEEISGRDLRWFFDYFINGTEIPEIQIRRTPSAAPNEVSGEIIVKNVPPDFQVRVEMRVETLGAPVEHSVATRGEVTPFTITTPQPATRLILDPNQRILRWTEAARRNRTQRALLAQFGDLERSGQFARAVELCAQALALDPENLASNEQQIRFALGRLRYREGQFAAARSALDKVLALSSLDPLEGDFNKAWSRVYLARIEKRRGRAEAARKVARAGLAMKSPALDAPVTWPEAPARETTAARELALLAK